MRWIAGSFILIGLLIACDKAPHSASSTEIADGIIGGIFEKTKSEIAGSTVALRSVSDKDPTCTATVIAPRILMTAAHCVQTMEPEDLQFAFDVVGSNRKAVVRGGKAIWIHENYLETISTCPLDEGHGACIGKAQIARIGTRHDIALILLKNEVPKGYVPVRLASPTEDGRVFLSKSIAAGYGVDLAFSKFDKNNDALMRRHSGKLKSVALKATTEIEGLDIAEKYDSILVLPTATESVCVGDSGGPLFVNDGKGLLQVGISSYLFDGQNQMPCGYKHAVYTDISRHREWIEKTSTALLAGRRPYEPKQAVGTFKESVRMLEKTPFSLNLKCATLKNPAALEINATVERRFVRTFDLRFRLADFNDKMTGDESWDEDQVTIHLLHDVFGAVDAWESTGDRRNVLRALFDQQPFALEVEYGGVRFDINDSLDTFFEVKSISADEVKLSAIDVGVRRLERRPKPDFDLEKMSCNLTIRLQNPLFSP